MEYKWNKIFTAVTAAMLLCAAGCSKKTAPGVPDDRSSTLSEIFRLMDERKYKDALPKVVHYQRLEPSNEFLSELRQIVCTNIAIQGAEELAQKGKLKEACDHLDDCISKYGDLPGIQSAKKVYLDLLELGRRIQTLKEPAGSADMRKNAEWLERYSRKFPNARLRNFAREKIRESAVMSKLEIDRAGFLIYADVMDQLEQGNLSQVLALSALLASEGRYPVHVQRIQNGGMFDAPYLNEMKEKQQGDTRPDLKQKVK